MDCTQSYWGCCGLNSNDWGGDSSPSACMLATTSRLYGSEGQGWTPSI